MNDLPEPPPKSPTSVVNQNFQPTSPKISFVQARFQDSPGSRIELLRAGSKASRLARYSAKYGSLKVFQELLIKLGYVTERGVVPSHVENLHKLINETGTNGVNCVHYAIIFRQAEFIAMLVEHFGSLIDLNKLSAPSAKPKKYSMSSAKDADAQISHHSVSPLQMVAISMQFFHQSAAMLLEPQQKEFVALMKISALFQSIAAFSSTAPQASSTTVGSLPKANPVVEQEQDSDTQGLGLAEENEGRVQTELLRTIKALRAAVHDNELDLIRVCLIDFNTQLFHMAPRRKDNLIIKFVEVMAESATGLQDDLKFELLNTLKDLAVSTLGSEVSIHFSDVRPLIFPLLANYSQWCVAKLRMEKFGKPKALFTRGLYLCQVTSHVLNCQFQFLSTDSESTLGKFYETLSTMVTAATGDAEAVAVLIYNAAKAIMAVIDKSLADRLARLVIVVEGLRNTISFSRHAGATVKMTLFIAVRDVFNHLKRGVVYSPEWIVFYGALESVLELALDSPSIELQEKVCDFLLENVPFVLDSVNMIATSDCATVVVVPIYIKILETAKLLELAVDCDANIRARYNTELGIRVDADIAFHAAHVDTPRNSRGHNLDINNVLLSNLLKDKPLVFKQIEDTANLRHLDHNGLCDFVMINILDPNESVNSIIKHAMRCSVNKEVHYKLSFCNFLINLSRSKMYDVNPVLKCFVDQFKCESAGFTARKIDVTQVEALNDEIRDMYTITDDIEIMQPLNLSADYCAALVEARLGPDNDPRARVFDVGKSISIINYLLSLGEGTLPDAGKTIDGLLIVGATGSGKSSLTNFLGGCHMIADDFGDVSVDLNRSAPLTRIGHGNESETLVPQYVMSQDGNLIMADTPGVLDTRGFEFSIANVVNIRRFLTFCTSVRILVLVEFASIQGRSNRNTVATASIDLVKDMLKETLDENMESILVGLTKYSNALPAVVDRDLKVFYETIKWPYSAKRCVRIDVLEDGLGDTKLRLLRSAIDQLKPIADSARIYPAAISEKDLHHMECIAKVLSNIKPLLNKGCYGEVLSRYQLLDGINCIGHPAIATFITDFRDLIESEIKNRFLRILLCVEESEDLRLRLEMKTLMTLISGVGILDVCFENSIERKSFEKQVGELKSQILVREQRHQEEKHKKISSEIEFLLLDLDRKLENAISANNTELRKIVSLLNPLSETLLGDLAMQKELDCCKKLRFLFGEMDMETNNREIEYCNPYLVPLTDLRAETHKCVMDKITAAILQAKIQVLHSHFNDMSEKLFGAIDKAVASHFGELYASLQIGFSIDNLHVLRHYGFSIYAINEMGTSLNKLRDMPGSDFESCELTLTSFVKTVTDAVCAKKAAVLCDAVATTTSSINRSVAQVHLLNKLLAELSGVNRQSFESSIQLVRKMLLDSPLERLRSIIDTHPSSYKEDVIIGLMDLELVQQVELPFALGEICAAREGILDKIYADETSRSKLFFDEFIMQFNVPFCKLQAACYDCEHKSVIAALTLENLPLSRQLLELQIILPFTFGLASVLDEAERKLVLLPQEYYTAVDVTYRALLDKAKSDCSLELSKLQLVSVIEQQLTSWNRPTFDVIAASTHLGRLNELDSKLHHATKTKLRRALVHLPQEHIASVIINVSDQYVAQLSTFFDKLNLLLRLENCFEQGEVAEIISTTHSTLLTAETLRMKKHCDEFTAQFNTDFAMFVAARQECGNCAEIALLNLHQPASEICVMLETHFSCLTSVRVLFSSAERRLSKFAGTFFNRVESDYEQLLDKAKSTFCKEVQMFGVFCKLDAHLSVQSTISADVVSDVNDQLMQLREHSSRSMFDAMKSKLLKVCFDAPREHIRRFLTSPPASYRSDISEHFDNMTVLGSVLYCFEAGELIVATNRLHEEVTQAEQARITRQCNKFENDVIIALSEMSEARRVYERWSDFEMSDMKSEAPLMEKLQKFAILVPCVHSLCELFSEAERTRATIAQEYFTDCTSVFVEAVDKAAAVIANELHKFKVCCKIETTLLREELTTVDNQNINSLLSQLQSTDAALFESYKSKVRQALFVLPLARLKHTVHAPQFDTYQQELTSAFSKLASIGEVTICFDDFEEVAVAIVEAKAMVLKLETERVSSDCKQFDTEFKTHFASFEAACHTCEDIADLAIINFSTEKDVQELLRLVEGHVSYTNTLIKLFETCDDNIRYYRHLYINRVDVAYVEKVAEAAAVVTKEIMKFKASGGIELLLLLPSLNVADVRQLNTEMSTLKESDRNMFNTLRLKIRRVLFEEPTSHVLLVINAHHPPASYLSDVTSYFEGLSVISNIDENCFESQEVNGKRAVIRDMVLALERDRVGATCRLFRTEFNALLASFVAARRDFSHWSDVLSLDLANLPLDTQIRMLSLVMPAAEPFSSFFAKLNPSLAAIETEYYADLSDVIKTEFNSMSDTVIEEFAVLMLCAAVETVWFGGEADITTDDLPAVNEALAQLQSRNEVLFDEYKGRIRQSMLTTPCQHATHVLHNQPPDYKHILQAQLFKMHVAKSISLSFQPGEVARHYEEIESLIITVERERIARLASLNTSNFRSEFLEFNVACRSASCVEVHSLDLSCGNVFDKLNMLAPLVPVAAALAKTLRGMDKASADENFALGDGTELKTAVATATTSILNEITKLKADKTVTYFLTAVYELIHDDLCTIDCLVRSVLEIDAGLHDRLKTAVSTKLFSDVLAANESIMVLRPAGYKAKLATNFDLLAGVSSAMVYCFKPKEVVLAIETSCRNVRNAELQHMTTICEEFGVKVEMAIDIFNSCNNEAAIGSALFQEAAWRERMNANHVAAANVLSKGSAQLKEQSAHCYSLVDHCVTAAIASATAKVELVLSDFADKISGNKIVVLFEQKVQLLKTKILAHVQQNYFLYISYMVLDKKVLISHGMKQADFSDVEELVDKCSSLPVESRTAILVANNSLMNEVHIKIIENICNILSLERKFSEYCKQLPALLDTLVSLSAPRAAVVIDSLKVGLAAYQSEIARCIISNELTKLVTIYTTLVMLARTIYKHVDIDMDKFTEMVNLELSRLWEESHTEMINGLNSTVPSRFRLEKLDRYLNIKNELIANKLLRKGKQSESEELHCSLSMEEAVCINFDPLLVPLSKNPDASMLSRRSEEINRAGWIVIKCFYLSTLLGLKKLRTQRFLQTKLNALTIDDRIGIGRVVLENRDHEFLGTAATEAISSIPEFKRLHNELFEIKASGVTLDMALKELKTEYITLTESGEVLPNKTKPNLFHNLKTASTSLWDEYMMHVGEYREGKTQQRLTENIKNLIKEIKPNFCNLSKVPEKIGQLIGCVFAQWSILEDGGNNQTESSQKMMLKRPHATQILSILRLMGVDNAGPMNNHLAEVKTGEGKSISLGIIAAVFAMFGYHVNVICYSPYLSDRDHKAFRELFAKLNVHSLISYLTIGNLVAHEMGDSLPSLREVVDSFLKRDPIPGPKKNSGKKLLLIDEVDIFFGDKFYGQTYDPLHIISDDLSHDLMQYVFDERNTLMSNPSTALATIREHATTAKLLRKYPNLEGLLDQQLGFMLRDLAEFPADGTCTHSCKIQGAQIGYMDGRTGHINYHTHTGYETGFAYLYYKSKGRFSSQTAGPHTQYGLRIAAGSILFSKLPNFSDVLLGLTGSLGCLSTGDKEILNGYRFQQKSFIPSTFKKKVMDVAPIEVVDGAIAKFHEAIVDEIEAKLRKGRTQLVVFETFDALIAFQDVLKGKPINHPDYKFPEVLSEELRASDRDAVISRAIGRKKITLMTRTYGRGTDFLCADQEVSDSGGVHIILTFSPTALPEEIQIRGRTCRQDNPGSFKMILYGGDLVKSGLMTEGEVQAGAGLTEELLAEKRLALDEIRHTATKAALLKSTVDFENTLMMVAAAKAKQTDRVTELLALFQ